MTTGQAAEVLGLSPDQFRQLSLEPGDTYVNRYHTVCALYGRERVEGLQDDPRVVTARRRRRGTVDWHVRFRRQYGDRRAALLDAARAMFELNRYAKRASGPTKDRTYELKDRLVRHLWDGGHCVSVHRHVKETEAKVCWGCYGAGCERCDGTGMWQDAGILEFLCFRFEVDDQRFCWHQPAEQARWVPEDRVVDQPDTDWEPGNGGLGDRPRMGFARAYALIEWVLGGDGDAGDGGPAACPKSSRRPTSGRCSP